MQHALLKLLTSCQNLWDRVLVKFQLTIFKKYDFILDTVRVCGNEVLKTGSFPDSLKCANARPIYKKEDLFEKRNYRPDSI